MPRHSLVPKMMYIREAQPFLEIFTSFFTGLRGNLIMRCILFTPEVIFSMCPVEKLSVFFKVPLLCSSKYLYCSMLNLSSSCEGYVVFLLGLWNKASSRAAESAQPNGAFTDLESPGACF